MPFPKLNLKGINLQEINKKPVKSQAKAQIIIESPPRKPPKLAFLFVVIVGLYLMNITVSWLFRHPPTHSLRRILRMRCASSESETQCSTPHKGGDYVVNIDQCEDAYDFNGIPWTELKKDQHNNYRIPSTSDLTLIIKNPCPKIVATVDTSNKALEMYASRRDTDSNKYIKKLVWVSDACWKEFTLRINDIIIFDKTPEQMIDSVRLKTKKAYSYVPDTDISGSISIEGKGCSKPIIIYTLRQ